MTYREFLESKMVIAPESGVEIDPGEVNPALKPHQRDAVVWAESVRCLNPSGWERRCRSWNSAAWRWPMKVAMR